MIPWPKLEGSQSRGTMGQALLPLSAVTNGSNPLKLKPKQARGLGPGCPKTGCPLILAMESFWELHGCNQHEEPVKFIHKIFLSDQNQLICRSRWGCPNHTLQFDDNVIIIKYLNFVLHIIAISSVIYKSANAELWCRSSSTTPVK